MQNPLVELAIDLVQQSLTWGPARIQASELLKAKLFEASEYYDPECPPEEQPEEELPGVPYHPEVRISHMEIDDLKKVIAQHYLTYNL